MKTRSAAAAAALAVTLAAFSAASSSALAANTTATANTHPAATQTAAVPSLASAAVGVANGPTRTEVANLPSNCGYIHTGNQYMDDYGAGFAPVYTYPFTGSPNQTWCWQIAKEGGSYLIPKNLASNGTVQCLDGGVNKNHMAIQVWGCNGTSDQRWCWNGTGYIVQIVSNLAVSSAGMYIRLVLDNPSGTKWSWQGSQPVPDGC